MNRTELIELMGDRLSDADLAGIDLDTIQAIVKAKIAAGPDAYLWAHDSGDVILWPSEASSVDDDGSHALDRWHVTSADLAALTNWIDKRA